MNDKLDYFINLGKEIFQDDNDVKRENILLWLWESSSEKKISLDRQEVEEVVSKIHANITNAHFAPQFHLNVGMLKKSLEGLDDNIPVFYDKSVESFSSQLLLSEVQQISEEKSKSIIATDTYEVVIKENKYYLNLYSPHVLAFSAYLSKDKEDKKVFLITAHY